jgi:hypothetical protein
MVLTTIHLQVQSDAHGEQFEASFWEHPKSDFSCRHHISWHGRVSSASLLPFVTSLIPPCPHCLVLSARADHLPVGRPIHGIDLSRRRLVSPKTCLKLKAGERFPSVWYAYLVFVTRQVHSKVSRPCIPHFESAVFAACDEESTVCGPGALIDLELCH